jgi:hypothetical protein
MPLTKNDEEAFSFIANNPKLRATMLEGLEKEGFKNHPAVKENIDFKERLEHHLKPIRDENEELKKEVKQIKNSEIYGRQRDSVRKAPFNFSDAKIAKLEERMGGKYAPQFVDFDDERKLTAYQAAALHFQREDSPVSASTFPVMDFAGPSQKAESWRESLTESDKSKNPLHMSRRERRRLGDKLWEEAKNDYMANLQNR